MKFRMDREALADAVAWTARSLPSRPTVPVLAGLLLTVDGDTLTVSGFDYEVSARAEMAIDAGDPGAALVSGRLLAEITRSLPAQPVQFATEGTRVAVSYTHLRAHETRHDLVCRLLLEKKKKKKKKK